MPFDMTSPIDRAAGAIASTPAVSTYDAPDPSFLDTLGAAYRRENLIGSALSSERVGMDSGKYFKIDPGYDAISDIAGYEKYADRFENSYNVAATQAIKSDIDRELEDQRTLAASGWVGVGLSVLASVTDPTILIPGGAFYRTGKVGYSAARSALSVGTAAAIGTAIQEGGLQATQETRTAQESLLAIGGSAILGGVIGMAGAKFMSHGAWKQLGDNLSAELADDVPNPVEVSDAIIRRMQSTGAAAVEDIKLDDLGVGGGRAAEAVARATSAMAINPGVQTLFSPSQAVRKTYAQMVDNPIYTKMNMEGRTLGPDVENLVKQYQRGALGQWMNSNKALFREARKAGFEGTKTDFNIRVARAARRGDVDEFGDAAVTKAAQEARDKIFDPLLKRAIENKLLPEDVKTTTAASYVTRYWNRTRLIGEEDRFRGILREWLSGELDKTIAKNEEIRIGNKVVEVQGLDEQYSRAFSRVQDTENTLAQRAETRAARLEAIKAQEMQRFDALGGRAPAAIVEIVKSANEGDALVSLVREANKLGAEVRGMMQYPVLNRLKKAGGVRLGSALAGELRAMGVTPQKFPGLFKRNSGIGEADNFERLRDDIFSTQAGDGANEDIYIGRDEFLAAVESELAGSRLMDDVQAGTVDAYESYASEAERWLEGIGLPKTATIGQIREKLSAVLRSEKLVDDLDEKIAKMNADLEEFDKAGDSFRDRRTVAEGEAAEMAARLQTLEEELNGLAQYVNASPRIKAMVDLARAKRDLTKARLKKAPIERRIGEIERVDPAKLSDELAAELKAKKTDLASADEAIAKLEAKTAKLEQFQPKFREDVAGILDDQDKASYIDDVITSIFDNLTGRGNGDAPDWLVPLKRGPLKERTLSIPDEKVEDFLENDMEMILRRYTRTMAAEVELTEKFGRADMRDQLDAIRAEYDDLSKAAKTPEERAKLRKALDRDLGNLQAFRDMIRGTYRAAEESSNWSKITRAALAWNYMRLLGGVTLTSLADGARLIGVHGVRAAMTEGFPGLVSGTRAAKIARQDARDLGAVTERVLQSRMSTLADLHDPYASGSVFDRHISNATNVFSRLTGLGWLNDTTKTIASVMTQNRMARNAINWADADKYEKAFMGFMGIDETMAGRIARQLQEHGVKDGNIWGANVSEWTDIQAQRTWAAALNKDVDRTIVTKGVADTPLWMKTNWGRLIGQFKSFALATHQRVLIAGLQERPHRLAEQMVIGSALGMLIGYMKYIERGDVEGANRLLENPGLWVAEGLDRSGVLAIPFEISNTMDKLRMDMVGNVPISIKGGMQAIAGDADRGGSLSRYASRNKTGAVLGPSAGLFEDLATIADQLSKGDLKKGGANALIRQVPGATLPGVRSAIHLGVKPALMGAVE